MCTIQYWFQYICCWKVMEKKQVTTSYIVIYYSTKEGPTFNQYLKLNENYYIHINYFCYYFTKLDTSN